MIENYLYEFFGFNDCIYKFDLSQNLTGKYYNLLTYNNNNEINYIISYIGQNNFIYFFHYQLNSNNIQLISNNIYNKAIKSKNNLSCKIFYSELICFYIINSYLYAQIFNVTEKFESKHINNISSSISEDDTIIIKSSISYYKKKILVCWSKKNENIFCSLYNITSKNFIENNNKNISNCIYDSFFLEIYLLKVNNNNINFYVVCQVSNNTFEILFLNENENKIEALDTIQIYEVENYISSHNYLFMNYNSLNTNINNGYNLTTYECPYNISFINDLTESTTTLFESISLLPSTINYISNKTINSTENYLYSSIISNSPIPKTEIHSSTTTKTKINEESIKMKKEDLVSNISNILNDKEIGETYKMKGDDFTLIIKPTNTTNDPSSTHVDFSQCELILRNYYNISNTSIITLLQLELNNNNSKSLTNQVEYSVYDQNFTKLNLSLCNDTNIQIFYAIKDNFLIDTEAISSLKNLGINVFDINDKFFWDICQPYSDTNNDLILEDRIKDIYQNYSLCENGCTYNDIDLNNMVVSCECKIKDNITTVISDINYNQLNIESSSNFDIIKCYEIIFSFKIKLSNIGFWIFTIMIILHFPLLVSYCHYGIKPVYTFVINEMIKFGYLKNNKNSINNNINKIKKKKKNNNKKANPPQKTKKK